MNEREIQEILNFRTDISPFLVHLTREYNGIAARENLENIIKEKTLRQSGKRVSDARFGIDDREFEEEERKQLFGAICFTETPLNEVHCLLEIQRRNFDLKPYGLVFMKERLSKRGVAPVFYLNNKMGDKDGVLRVLCSLGESNKTKEESKKILPLIAFFGKHITPPNARAPKNGEHDFLWEREWRYPYICGNLVFTEEDVFVGLCPHEEIGQFEKQFSPIKFVDPIRNMKWYAPTLVESRKRLNLTCSVV